MSSPPIVDSKTEKYEPHATIQYAAQILFLLKSSEHEWKACWSEHDEKVYQGLVAMLTTAMAKPSADVFAYFQTDKRGQHFLRWKYGGEAEGTFEPLYRNPFGVATARPAKEHPADNDFDWLDRTKKNVDDLEILRRIVTGAGKSGGLRARQPRWAHVSVLTTLGSTQSAELCRRFGLDPDEFLPSLRIPNSKRRRP